MNRYDFRAIEDRWRARWRKMDLYLTGTDPDRDPFYCLDFFPYPSGAGLSVGHCKNYVPTDVISRKKRQEGYNVLHPMGWDAFGQPTEEYAIRTGVHPREVTRRNTRTYKRQMKLIETDYDWSREIDSSDPDYYKWTQYFFLLLYDRGLAYQDTSYQMWCPRCRIVLSNEEAAGGVCWRCEGEVTRKRMRQWFLKITDYAERLLSDLDDLDWPDSIKSMQRNWIGRSEGAEIDFTVHTASGEEIPLSVFTTRLDTIFGATFCVVAPEHSRLSDLTTPERTEEVEDYVTKARKRSDRDRLAVSEREKTGVFTGSYAINPYNGQEIPVFVADYVLEGYGTSAIMAVPAHDERDYAFARKFDLDVVEVVAPGGEPQGVEDGATVADGLLINSGSFDGLDSQTARERMAEHARREGFGRAEVRYRIRDWVVSRQRYWGAPIPMVHCDRCGAVPDRDLPVELPEVESYQPDETGRSPLARAEDWVATTCPSCGGPALRDTNTMAGFACSSWYFLRFASPHEKDRPFDPRAVEYWLPVDLYVGGAEHAVMHLIYARFWTKVMYDAGLIGFREPFLVLRNQGMILGEDGQKMSKSKGNVVTPDEMVERYGADALRLYVLFMGPFEADLAWSEEGIAGVYRFLGRLWSICCECPEESDDEDPDLASEVRHHLATTLMRVTRDVESFKFNTAVAALMEFVNFLSSRREESSTAASTWRGAIRDLLTVMAPMTPFITEELWHRLGFPGETVHRHPWPEWSESDLKRDTVEMVVQVRGRIRARITVDADASEEEIKRAALRHERIASILDGEEPGRVIVVPGSLVNIIP